MKLPSFTVKIPAILDNIRTIETFIHYAQTVYHFDEDIYGNILVAVTEAANNAMTHGCRMDANQLIELSLEGTEDRIIFVITDPGPGFDYESLPDPTDPENLEKIGGRGIYLMKSLTDEVSFSDEGRKVTMVFFIHSFA